MQLISNLGKMRRFIVVLGLVAGVSGCAATYENHGYVPTDSDLEQITVGVDTRDTVAQTVGRPTSLGVLTESSWYFVQSRWRNFAYKAPEIVDRQLVAIRFSSKGVVENIERFTLEDGRVVPLSRRVTDSNIKGKSFLRQLLGSVGNFSASQFLSKN